MLKEFELENTNFSSSTYIKMDIVYSSSDVSFLFAQNPLFSSLDCPIKEFFRTIKKYEKEKNTKGKCRYGIILTFLLDKNRPKNELKTLVYKIMERFDNLPFYCFKVKKGAGIYLVFYVYERQYYPEGKNDVYVKDVYQDVKTGRIYPKKMTENCVKIHSKGEEKVGKVVYFSNKCNHFRFSNGKQFNIWMFELKKYYNELLNDMFKASKRFGITFKKFVYTDLPKNNRAEATEWNKLIKQLEEKFDEAFFVIYDNMRITDEIEQKFKTLYLKYQEIIKTGEFKYRYGSHRNRKSFTFKINLFKHTTANEAFVDYFVRDISEFTAYVLNL